MNNDKAAIIHQATQRLLEMTQEEFDALVKEHIDTPLARAVSGKAPCPHPGDVEWHREDAIRQARPYGLQTEVLEAFNRYIVNGDDPCHAEWCALYDWDICSCPEGGTNGLLSLE